MTATMEELKTHPQFDAQSIYRKEIARPQKQFSLNRVAFRKQIPISLRIDFAGERECGRLMRLGTFLRPICARISSISGTGILTAALLIHLSGFGSKAADAFTEDFSGTTLTPLLIKPNVFASGANANPVGTLQNPSSNLRQFVTTAAADYNTVDFEMAVTVTVRASNPSQTAFVGLGSGIPDPAYFTEPHTSVYFRLFPNDFLSGTLDLTVSTAPASPTTVVVSSSPHPGEGTHRVQIKKVANFVTLSCDVNYTGGPFVADYTVTRRMDTQLAFLNSTNSRLFFGVQGANTTFDDLSIKVSPKASFDPLLGLIAYYPFNGNANDSTTNGINGTVLNGSFDLDRFSNPTNAIRLTGIRNPESNVKFPTAAGRLNLPNDFTVSAWAKLEGGTEGPRFVSTSGFELTFQDPSRPTNGINFNNSFANGGFAAAFTTNTFQKGKWLQVVGRRIGSTLSIFVNGKLEGEAVASLPQSYNRGFTPEIGGNSGNDADAFGGLVDEVRFYNRPLTDSEIAALYRIESLPPDTLAIRTKTVRVSLGLRLGIGYQLESSDNLTSWNPVGLPFTATNTVLEADFDSDAFGQYFRLKRVP